MKNNQSQKNISIGWKTYKLNNLVDIVNGKTPLRSRSDFWIDGTIPWFTIDDIRSNGRFINKTNQTVTDVALKESGIKIIPENSTLICCTASVGECALTQIPLTTNQQFNALIVKDKKVINPLFLYYVAQTFDSRLKQIMGSTTFGFVSVGTLSDFNIEIPSDIKEQQKIAEILSKVDEDIEKTEKVIEETEKLKKGLINEFFENGIGKTKFKKSKLGIIAEISTGGTPRTTISEYWNGDINWMASGEVNQKIVKFTEKKITKLGLDNCNSEILSKGTIMIALAGQGKTRGTVAILDIETACNQSLAGIFTKDKKIILNEYIYYNLDSRYQEIRNINGDEGRGGLNLQILRDMDISFPEEIEKQREIVEILSSVDEKISVNKKLKEKLIQLKKGLMSDLLSGKVRIINK